MIHNDSAPIEPRNLPQPPTARTGWPWTSVAANPPAFPRQAGSSGLPKVCIVTPSYNQGEFLEETIRSVLLQDYPHIDYYVLDGGSDDNSVEVIEKYADYLTGWSSGPDGGQADAVRKGWEQTDGEILAYLNSDDTYFPGSVSSAVHSLLTHDNAPATHGNELLIDRQGFCIRHKQARTVNRLDLLKLNFISQPTTFIRTDYYRKCPGIDLSYHNSFDFVLWLALSEFGEFVHVNKTIATTRWYDDAKTIKNRHQVAVELRRAVLSALERTDIDPLVRRSVLHSLYRLVSEIFLEDGQHTLDGLCYYYKMVWETSDRGLIEKLASSCRPASRQWRQQFRNRPQIHQDSDLDKLHWSEFSI